jgi:hypothetical protein
MEDIDNVGKSDNVEEDERNINNNEIDRMPLATSSIEATCFRRCYPFMHQRILT